MRENLRSTVALLFWTGIVDGEETKDFMWMALWKNASKIRAGQFIDEQVLCGVKLVFPHFA